MKAFIVLASVLAVVSAQSRLLGVPNQLGLAQQQLIGRQGEFIPIVRQASAINPDGSYQYQYETANGIAAGEQGIGGQAVQGTAQWTAPDGTPVSLQYTADENGYHAQGSHVPQTPEHILRALEYIRTHPYNEEEERRRQLARDARDQALNGGGQLSRVPQGIVGPVVQRPLNAPLRQTFAAQQFDAQQQFLAQQQQIAAQQQFAGLNRQF